MTRCLRLSGGEVEVSKGLVEVRAPVAGAVENKLEGERKGQGRDISRQARWDSRMSMGEGDAERS